MFSRPLAKEAVVVVRWKMTMKEVYGGRLVLSVLPCSQESRGPTQLTS